MPGMGQPRSGNDGEGHLLVDQRRVSPDEFQAESLDKV